MALTMIRLRMASDCAASVGMPVLSVVASAAAVWFDDLIRPELRAVLPLSVWTVRRASHRKKARVGPAMTLVVNLPHQSE